jgi:UDPglucose 6-dehydrogenase
MAGELLTRPWPGTRVAVLGAAFKPDSDDIRDSPALNVAGRLHLQGACVSVYDPRAMDNARRLWPTLTYAGSVAEACAGAHVTLVLTEWQEFRDLDPEELGSIVARRAVVDGRNCLDPVRWTAAGWIHRGPGRPVQPEPLLSLDHATRPEWAVNGQAV